MIEGVELRDIDRYGDDRGYFGEIFRAAAFEGGFAQSNHSHSKQGVLRGLHFHRRQADLWYLVSGRAQVALADLRDEVPDPPVQTLILDPAVPVTLYIPPGVAHGFLALSDLDLIYWVTEEYDASDEFGVAWDDPILAVPWETKEPLLSRRDQENPRLEWQNIPKF